MKSNVFFFKDVSATGAKILNFVVTEQMIYRQNICSIIA